MKPCCLQILYLYGETSRNCILIIMKWRDTRLLLQIPMKLNLSDTVSRCLLHLFLPSSLWDHHFRISCSVSSTPTRKRSFQGINIKCNIFSVDINDIANAIDPSFTTSLYSTGPGDNKSNS